jgi:hypothetical protein
MVVRAITVEPDVYVTMQVWRGVADVTEGSSSTPDDAPARARAIEDAIATWTHRSRTGNATFVEVRHVILEIYPDGHTDIVESYSEFVVGGMHLENKLPALDARYRS